MTELTLGEVTLPTAAVGASNPLPPLFAGGNADKTADMAAAPPDMRAAAAYGRVSSICPYPMQDGYGRDRRPRRHPVAVLENERLRATVLPELGGRLRSLVDLTSGEELLFANPIAQPANLALRDAWLAGGLEWNIGTIGHSPLTCEPVHAVRVRGADGSPVLRLYEFERLRRVVFQVDLHLPPGSPVLVVHVRIANPNAHPVPMYWWSNIAVPQAAGTRVLAPADESFSYSYDNVLRREPVAGADGESGGDGAAGRDISYPARFADAADFFFDLADHPQPWIAAVPESGRGLFQTSTPNLPGRKLFRWGTGPGGRRWQEWLTGSGQGYAEIQAGLARTQFEHLPMPAGATWSWTECYGPIHLEPATAAGAWARARAAAERAVLAAVDRQQLAGWHAAAHALADAAPDAVLHTGSGWGALENRVRRRSAEPLLDRPGTPFVDGTLGAEQRPWLTLLETGEYPDPEPGAFPASVHLHPAVADLLAASPGWAAPALLGVARAGQGDVDGARAAWQESLRRTENAYSHRNLAVLAGQHGDARGAAEEYRKALADNRAHPSLVAEALRALIAADAAAEALDLLDALPAPVRDRGRIRLLEATAALDAGELDRCGEILTDTGFAVPDLREGEDSLDQLWYDYRTRRTAADRGIEPDEALRAEIRRTVTVPEHLDFRMHAAGDRSERR